MEVVAGHEDLAAHLDHMGRGAVQDLRQALDRPDVGRDVLADRAVSARGARDQATVLVEQGHRQAVDLGLRHDVDGFTLLQAEEATDAP